MNEPLCPYAGQAQAYHDGELSSAERAAFVPHLRGCWSCTTELAWMNELRGVLRQGQQPVVPTDLVTRIQGRIAREADRPVLRLTWWLTAVAAAVVVVCLPQLHLAGGVQAVAEAAPAWELAALPASTEVGLSDEQQLARWMVADLTGGAGSTGAKEGQRESQP